MELLSIGIILGLLFMSGLFSGLNLGFMSLGKEELQRKISMGDERASVVYRLRKNGNLLLCTILIGNVLVNNILAVYMSEMFTGTTAVIVATALVVVFGEILPQAICSRYPLEIGAKAAPIFRVFMYALWIICWPLSKIMDFFLGPEPPVRHTKFELGEMIRDHQMDDTSEIDAREAKTVLGALKFSDMTVREVMTPKKNVFRFYEDDVITEELIKEIKDHGHTRIPVFKNKTDKVVGVVLVKSLIGVRIGEKIMSQARGAITVRDNENLDDVLDKFKKERIHLFIVTDEHENILGIITLEDILEEVFQYEILDETDKYVDMRNMDDKIEDETVNEG
jgi:metal transporter CNNM